MLEEISSVSEQKRFVSRQELASCKGRLAQFTWRLAVRRKESTHYIGQKLAQVRHDLISNGTR